MRAFKCSCMRAGALVGDVLEAEAADDDDEQNEQNQDCSSGSPHAAYVAYSASWTVCVRTCKTVDIFHLLSPLCSLLGSFGKVPP